MARKNKLAEHVLEIMASDKPVKLLAHEFGVNIKSIYDARNGGRNYRWLKEKPLTPEQIQAIRQSELPVSKLAKKYKVTANTIHKALMPIEGYPTGLSPMLERAIQTDGFKAPELALLVYYLNNPTNHSLYNASVALGCSLPRLTSARKRLEAHGFLVVESKGREAKVRVCYE